MISVIVVFPKLEESKSIKNLLIRSGIDVLSACTTAAQVIQLAEDMEYGIVISGYKFADMMYDELLECLPETFEMLLIASKRYCQEESNGELQCLSMPIKASQLVERVQMLYDKLYLRQKKDRAKPRVRTEQEKRTILQAKELLMRQRALTEQEAHRYLQQRSMQNGTGMVETAQMVLEILGVAEGG